MYIKSKKINIFLQNFRKMLRKGFISQLHQVKSFELNLTFYAILKKIANFEVNISKNRQKTKFIDK